MPSHTVSEKRKAKKSLGTSHNSSHGTKVVKVTKTPKSVSVKITKRTPAKRKTRKV